MNSILRSCNRAFREAARSPYANRRTAIAASSLFGGALYYYWNQRQHPAPLNPTDKVQIDDATSLAGNEQGTVEVNLPRLVQTMGASMYEKPIAEVAVKELLQNAFDSIKEAVYKGLIKEGDIKIYFNAADRSITIEDNGMGMTPEIVRNAFFTIGGSDKGKVPPELSSGGYGQAKIALLFGVEKISLRTTRDGITTEACLTPKDLFGKHVQLSKSLCDKTEHGTRVKLWIPKTKISNGSEKSIVFGIFPDSYPALQAPLIGPAKITVISKFFASNSQTLPIGINFKKPLYATVQFDWGSAEIYIEDNLSQHPSHHILSSGVFQFQYFFGTNSRGQEIIPRNIIVNIKPNVFPEDSMYPFTNNREGFREGIKDDIVSLGSYLRDISNNMEKNQLQNLLMRSTFCMPRQKIGQEKGDEGKWEKFISENSKVYSNTTRPSSTSFILRKQHPPFRTDRPIATGFQLSSLTKCPKDHPILVNNTTANFFLEGENQKEARRFFATLGSIYSNMIEEIVKKKLPKYASLRSGNYYAGIILDHDVRGLNLPPDMVKALLVNPLAVEAATVDGIRRNLLNTMIHEIAHELITEHGVKHNTAMTDLMTWLADQGVLKTVEERLDQLLTTNKELVSKMREEYLKAKPLEKLSAGMGID